MKQSFSESEAEQNEVEIKFKTYVFRVYTVHTQFFFQRNII